MQFLAVLGWVFLGIGCSVFLCLFFGIEKACGARARETETSAGAWRRV